MAKPIGPKKVHRYSEAFKATAVKLSQLADRCGRIGGVHG